MKIFKGFFPPHQKAPISPFLSRLEISHCSQLRYIKGLFGKQYIGQVERQAFPSVNL
jgi:hypothetical protein